MENLLIPYEAQRQVGCGRVLVFAPHPDDEVFGCGGAIMRHVTAGDPVRVVIVTDGGRNPNAPDSDDYILEREQESIRAADVLGYGHPEFWRMKDRELVYGESLVRRIEVAIQEYLADLVYAPSIHEIHPDHRALAMAAMEAVRRKGDGRKLVMYEVGMPLLPNLLLDISDLAERKAAAMRCFTSQLAIQPYDRHIAALNCYRTYTLASDVTAAEAYKLVTYERPGNDEMGFNKPESEIQNAPIVNWEKQHAPLVSVIVRSIGRFELNEALDSVAVQTYPNIEVVVVNAKGSGHPGLGDRCGRFPMRVYATGESLGRSRAANLGLDNALGKYLLFLDDDDWFLPEHVSGLVEALDFKGALVAYTGVKCVKEAQGTRWEQVHVFNDPFDGIRLLCENYLPIHAVLFARSLLKDGCRFDESLDIYEDWDFWIQLSLKSEFVHVDRVSAVYRISGLSGFGISGDADTIKRGSEDLFDKWRHNWRKQDLYGLMQVAKSHYEWSRLYGDQEQLGAMLKRLHAENRLLHQYCAELDEEIERARGATSTLQDRPQELNHDLHPILDSRRWRVTRPLRKAAEGARRLWARTATVLARAHRYVTVAREVLRNEGPKALVSRVACRIARRFPELPPTTSRFTLAPQAGRLRFAICARPEITIVVLMRGDRLQTFSCLQAVLVHSGEVPYEIIAIDLSDSWDGILLQDIEGIHLLGSEDAQKALTGFGITSFARGEYLVFLQDQTLVTCGWLQTLLASCKRDNSIGLIGPKLVSEDGRLLSAGGFFDADGTLRLHGKGDVANRPEFGYLRTVDFCPAPCFLVRKAAFEEAGGLDPLLSHSTEQAAYLAFRLSRAGWKVVCQPTALAACFTTSPWQGEISALARRPSALWKERLAEYKRTGGKTSSTTLAFNGRRVLVLDACQLTPDQDSGSLRMFRILEILLSLGFRITFIPANLEYRDGYTALLQERGMEVIYAPFLSSVERYLDEHGKNFNAILMSRVEIADRYIDKVSQAAPQALLLFDTVDLHYVREQRLARLESSKTLHRLAEQRRQQEIAVMKKADVTLVVSPVERDTLREDAPDVVVEIVSNIHEVYGSRTPFAKRSGIMFVGGFYHKPNTDAVVFFVNDILPLVRKSLPEALFYIVGANPTQEVRALASKDVIVTGHVSDISDYFNRCRVSVAPLRYGAGVKGKINMSLSYGLPVVATSIAVEGMYLTNGMNVLIADEPQSFAQALTRLYDDEALWERLSCNGLSNVAEHFSVAAAKQALERVLSLGPVPT